MIDETESDLAVVWTRLRGARGVAGRRLAPRPPHSSVGVGGCGAAPQRPPGEEPAAGDSSGARMQYLLLRARSEPWQPSQC